MKINPLNQNQQQNQKNIQVEDIKEVDIKNITKQQVKIKMHSDDDKLEMLGDGKRKETFEALEEYGVKKEFLYNIDLSKSFVDRHYLIMNNIKSIISDSTSEEMSFEDRLSNQNTIDGFTRDLKSLSKNIEGKLKTDEFDPKNMELDGVMSLAKMGKVTVRSRKGRNERIVIYYTGQQNRNVEVDLDKNTGEIGILFGKNYEKITNKTLQEVLSKDGFEASLNPRDLEKSFVSGLANDEGEALPLNEDLDRALRLDGEDKSFNEIKGKNIFEFKKSEELVGLSIMTSIEAQESIVKMDNALGLAEDGKKRLVEMRDSLEVDLGKYYTNIFGEKNIKNLDEAQEKIRNVQENMLEDRNYEKYLERIKDPALVYKLLK